jgi:hypothetical protein
MTPKFRERGDIEFELRGVSPRLQTWMRSYVVLSAICLYNNCGGPHSPNLPLQVLRLVQRPLAKEASERGTLVSRERCGDFED